MFGFAWDEIAVIVGGSFLAARALWTFGRVLWCFAFDYDHPFRPSAHTGRFVGAAGVLLAIGLLSIVTGGLIQAGGLAIAVLAYTIVGLFGCFFAVTFDLSFDLTMYLLSIRLRVFRMPRYRERLLHGEENVRLEAIHRLGSIGLRARPARPELLALFADQAPALRLAAVQTVLFTIPELDDDDSDVPKAARLLLADADLAIRVHAAAILAAYRSPPGDLVPVLCDGLKSDKEDVAAPALRALGRLGPAAEPALPLLCDTLFKCIDSFNFPVDCRESDVAGNVIETLKRIGAAAVPVFIDLLERGDSLTKWQAARALGCMGEPARIALPALTKVAIQQSTLASPEAKKAIKKLGGDDIR